MKEAAHKRTNTVAPHLHEVLRAAKYTDTERGTVGASGCGRGLGQPLFDGDRAPVGGDGKGLETDGGDGYTQRE